MDETYLGDSVYAEHDGFHVWIWTNNGIDRSRKIALEPAVLDALAAYRGELVERRRAALLEGQP